MFHPFLYLGQYKALDKFKELGFKTFDGILDESYDNLEVNGFKTSIVLLELIIVK